MTELLVPASLAAGARRWGHGAWLDELPATVASLCEHWSLSLGPAFQPGGNASWVAPARTGSGQDVVLKVGWYHPEAAHEAQGLTEWDGDGAVRLLEARKLEDGMALLLERCLPGTTLRGRPEPEQDAVITRLLKRLWRQPAAEHPFRPLQEMCDQWADAYEARLPDDRDVLDPALQQNGAALMRSLPASGQCALLLCTDLHAGNVLAARREPWLAIDPKPYVGDPTYDLVQHMLNCRGRLLRDARSLAANLATMAGLEPDRLLLWLFARCVIESPDDDPDLAEVARRLAPGVWRQDEDEGAGKQRLGPTSRWT